MRWREGLLLSVEGAGAKTLRFSQIMEVTMSTSGGVALKCLIISKTAYGVLIPKPDMIVR